MLVWLNDDMVDVERAFELLLGKDDRRSRLQRMTNAELEHGVQVGRGKIGDDQLGIEKHVVHRDIDHP
jgi:hypothetical protein